jgi:serine/threonine protein kinase/Tol biopolymer transport system component
MSLTSGTRLGAYEIVTPLGAGGMGEVYRARDTRLGREVAVKILPALFASDPERLARFEQEARAAATLSHPNIAAVYDVGVDGGTHYIVQELLAGSSLRDVMTAQRSKPIRNWVAMAAGIADALAAAHRAGIVHRDIKPENVIVTEDGHPKVLDFGLAKLAEPGADVLSANSPTMMGTMAGAVLGTIGYMSPEQAAGQPADRRTDIFALGCVLYEMIAARRPFEGRSAAEVIAHVLHDEPPAIAGIRPDVPAGIARVIHKCLAKEPGRRYQHADDLVVDLREAEREEPKAAAAPIGHAPSRGLGPAWWIAIVALAVALTALATRNLLPVVSPDRSVVRFSTPSGGLAGTYNRVLAVAPDGRSIASTRSQGFNVRALDDMDASVASVGDSSLREPAFSPAGDEIAFWASDQIRRVPVGGGTDVAVGPSPGRPMGMSWSEDGFIYYGRGREGIWRLPASGGSPEQVKAVADGEYAHGPQRVPGTDWIIFTRASRVNGWNDAAIVAARLGSGEERTLVEPAHEGRWAPGYLTYVHDSLLFAVPFDERALEITGDPELLAEGLVLSSDDMTGAASYDISRTGVLAYVGGRGAATTRLVWLDGARETPLPATVGLVTQAELSPDGTRVAVRAFANGWHIWWFDADGATGTKLTAEGTNRNPVWSADGEWIYYASDQNGELDIWRRRTDLSAQAELVYGAAGNQVPVGISSDLRQLVFITLDPIGSTIARVNLERPDDVQMLVDRPIDAPNASLSPDGRLLSYQSMIGGDWQVRVLDMETGRQRTVDAGFSTAWSSDGKTLLYVSFQDLGDQAASVKMVRVSPGPAVEPLGTVLSGPAFSNRCCDLVGPDRVLAILDASTSPPINVVVNWPELVKGGR